MSSQSTKPVPTTKPPQSTTSASNTTSTSNTNPSPNTASASTTTPAQTHTPSTYIIIPGSVTGDLWHVAAAQILSSLYDKAFPRLIAVVVVTARKDGDGPQDQVRKDAEFQNGRVTFNYLRFIGLKVMLLKLIGTDPGTPKIEQAMSSQPETWFDEAYDAQTGEHDMLKEGRFFEDLSFDQLTGLNVINAMKTELKGQHFPNLNAFDNNPVRGRVLQLKIATTIAMNLLREPSMRQDRRTTLTKRMYEGPMVSISGVHKAAGDQKYEMLQGLIASIKDSYVKKRKTFNGIILENYRKGHANGGTNTTFKLSQRLQQLANARNLAVIAISATATEEGYREVKSRYDNAILDLYNKTSKTENGDTVWANTPWPGLDPRAQAYFWHLVAEDKTGMIKGLIGGRSGSIDVAAFCGVKTLFWDEPWIRYACSPAGASQTTQTTQTTQGTQGTQGTQDSKTFRPRFMNWVDCPPDGDDDAISQVPQCLRSQQLMLLMGITAPLRVQDGQTWLWGDYEGGDVTADDISKMQNLVRREEISKFRLKTKNGATLTLQDMRKDLERDDLGIHANVIDDWLNLP